jgi:hypothetical protein
LRKGFEKRDVSPTLGIEPNQSRRYICDENTMDEADCQSPTEEIATSLCRRG